MLLSVAMAAGKYYVKIAEYLISGVMAVGMETQRHFVQPAMMIRKLIFGKVCLKVPVMSFYDKTG